MLTERFREDHSSIGTMANPINLADRRFWDSYGNVRFAPAASSDPIVSYLEMHLSKSDGRCLEVGCFPGQFLPALGQMGYELNGIDLTDGVDDRLPAWLQSVGCRVGEFYKADFFDYQLDQQFELVCSFGFIEHFIEWEAVIERHAELVAPGGWLVITAPNFRGVVQHALHHKLDAVNLARHNLDAMRPQAWASLVADLGFEVQHCGYIGAFDFWVEAQERTATELFLRKVVGGAKPLLRRLLKRPHASYSPYCGLVARRV